MWAQYDWGKGPEVCGRPTCLFCAWLAWSRFRVVIPTWDRTLGTTLSCIDAMLRRVGAAPTYLLTDNERALAALCVVDGDPGFLGDLKQWRPGPPGWRTP